MKQKRKRLNITSFELQLIKNYYNFRQANLEKVETVNSSATKKQHTFVCYGTINVLSSYQRDMFNNFVITEKNKVEIHLERLTSSSLKWLIRFSHLKNIEHIINSGIYKIVIKINSDKPTQWGVFEHYISFFKIINQIKALSPTDETTFSFNPSIIIETSATNILVPRRPERLKKQINQKINIQIRSYLVFLTNKLKNLAK